MIGDAATAHTNGSFNALAVNALNFLLGSVGKPGGISFSATVTPESELRGILRPRLDVFVKQIQSSPDAVKVLLLYNANPVFATPPGWRVREAFDKIPFIASFGSFIDETSALADLILPDHSSLESWLDDAPPSGTTRMVASLAPPAMNPLHNTRAMPDVLLDVAHQLGGDLAKALPWKTYEEVLQAAFTAVYKEQASKVAKDADEFWSKAQDAGRLVERRRRSPLRLAPQKLPGPPRKYTAPQFDGDRRRVSLPLPALRFADVVRRLARPSALDAGNARPALDPSCGVRGLRSTRRPPRNSASNKGDLIEVASQHGTLRAPAFVTPGIAPDCVAMPVGRDIENFTRYASGARREPDLDPRADDGRGDAARSPGRRLA